jgi:integrase
MKARMVKVLGYLLKNAGIRIFPQNLIRSFHRVVKKAGIERLRFHDLRHTFATRLVQNGVDLYRVQKLGRWKSTSMIMRYAHHYAENLRPGIETMDRGDSKNINITIAKK